MAMRRVLLPIALMFALAAGAAEPPTDPVVAARALVGSAAAAEKVGDVARARVALEEATLLRPTHPGLFLMLADLQARDGDHDGALGSLATYAGFGALLPPEPPGSLAPLLHLPIAAPIRERLEANAATIATSVAFATPAEPGLLTESLAWDPAGGRILLASVATRRVLALARDGNLSPFVNAGIDSPVGLEADPARDLLWIGHAAIEQTPGIGKDEIGRAGLLAVRLSDGAPVRSVALPEDGQPHVPGDMAVSADGTLWITDSAAGAVLRLKPGATAVEPVVTGPALPSPQGIVAAPDGKGLILADYSKGLFRLDPETGALAPLAPPQGASLLGIDGLGVQGDGLIAIQNGFRPNRVLRLTLAGDRIAALTVTDVNRPEFDEPTNGTTTPDGFVYVAASRWERFGPGGMAKPGTETGTVLLRLP